VIFVFSTGEITFELKLVIVIAPVLSTEIYFGRLENVLYVTITLWLGVKASTGVIIWIDVLETLVIVAYVPPIVTVRSLERATGKNDPVITRSAPPKL
jgi:hypothetical protein